MAQSDPLPPLLEGRVVWQHVVGPDEGRIDPYHLLVLPDRVGGVFVASFVQAPSTAKDWTPCHPAISHHDPAGRVQWMRVRDAELETGFPGYRHAPLAGAVAADGNLWLVAPYLKRKEAPAALALQFAAADGRILQRRSLPFPADPTVTDGDLVRPTQFLPRANGSVMLLGTASRIGNRYAWWLGWRDIGGSSWDLRVERPDPEKRPPDARDIWGQETPDGSTSFIAVTYPHQWVTRGSREGKGGSWQRLPDAMLSPLPTRDAIAYLEDVSGSRALKMLDFATNRVTTLLEAVPPSRVERNSGAVELVSITGDGTFVMQTPVQFRKGPSGPEIYREATLVSRDGLKMWRIPLRSWDRIVDSRSVLRLEPASGPWKDCPGPKCPGWRVSLVAYSP